VGPLEFAAQGLWQLWAAALRAEHSACGNWRSAS